MGWYRFICNWYWNGAYVYNIYCGYTESGKLENTRYSSSFQYVYAYDRQFTRSCFARRNFKRTIEWVFTKGRRANRPDDYCRFCQYNIRQCYDKCDVTGDIGYFRKWFILFVAGSFLGSVYFCDYYVCVNHIFAKIEKLINR